jgi:hypothetical protein
MFSLKRNNLPSRFHISLYLPPFLPLSLGYLSLSFSLSLSLPVRIPPTLNFSIYLTLFLYDWSHF